MDGETTAPAGTSPNRSASNREVRTTTGRAWTIKTLIFILALGGLAVWGWYDAFHEYPQRGRLHEAFMLQEYLREADKAFQLAQASVEDPAAEYRRLSGIEPPAMTPVERARFAWLRSVSRLKSLSGITRQNQAELAARSDPARPREDTRTMFADPRLVLTTLSNQLAQASQPKPLAAYDLPMQFVFLFGGAAGCIYLIGLFITVRSRVYRYDPESHRLTLPNGRTVVPADIALVDKRQWDKFIVFLRPVDGSAEIRLDLYRHHPLEEWILEMEKLTPGYQPPDEDEPAEVGAAPESGA